MQLLDPHATWLPVIEVYQSEALLLLKPTFSVDAELSFSSVAAR